MTESQDQQSNHLAERYWTIYPVVDDQGTNVDPWYALGKFQNRFGCPPKCIWYHADYPIPRQAQVDLMAQGILCAHNRHATPNTVYIGPVPEQQE